MGSETKVECVADVRAELGEGPVWAAEQALYWVDINGRRIFRLDAVGKRDEWPTPMRVGSIAPRAGGGFIAGTDQGIAQDLDGDIIVGDLDQGGSNSQTTVAGYGAIIA